LVSLLSRGVIGAVAPDGVLTATQTLLLRAVVPAMTGFAADLGSPPLDAAGLAHALRHHALAFRTRIVQLMVLLALVRRPLPPEVADSVAAYAAELSVEEGMLPVAHRFAEGSLGLAAFDFERNGYTAAWDEAAAGSLYTTRRLASAWDLDVADDDLARRWQSLEGLPEGTIGRLVTDFYRARGFVYPGRPGSAPPLLAQHDWVHVLADYGTTVESELEVFAFIARANEDLHAFSLLAMVVSLFETGYLRTGAGLFEASPGHLSRHGVPERVADAMRRGALCTSTDFLRCDWFALAELPLEQARAQFAVPAKGSEAVAAGSVGPWERGGISPFQVAAGTALAVAEGRRYESFGAEVGED
ncbi:MAG TPA: hypothetical protein VE991_14930, partial [Acidimicrobiales bacterium]|nr:hypothetical protein [Acidimicrobiales bacterium]